MNHDGASRDGHKRASSVKAKTKKKTRTLPKQTSERIHVNSSESNWGLLLLLGGLLSSFEYRGFFRRCNFIFT